MKIRIKSANEIGKLITGVNIAGRPLIRGYPIEPSMWRLCGQEVIPTYRAADRYVQEDGWAWPDGTYEVIKEKPNLQVDDKVLVRNSPDREWQPRHFARWDGDRMLCFVAGTTSWSVAAIQTTARWTQWKLPNE